MTTSYSITRNQVTVAALRKLGVIEPGDTSTSGTIDTNILDNAAITFNLMVKQWMTEGLKIWTVSEYTLPLVASTTSYTIGPGMDLNTDRPLKCIQAFLRNTSTTPNLDIPVQIISQQEYNLLSSKGNSGVTNSIYLKTSATYSTVYVWLTPDTNTSTNYELHMIVQRPLSDMNTSTATLDFPNEWFNALVWGLADELAIEFSVPANHRQEIMAKATMYRTKLEDWDQEFTPTFFQPDQRSGSYSSRYI
ncbi:hypothetical protein UFOVP1590_11 [uncultured Caudovirales phage]|uniref:Tail tubular protein A n=1 Tax=uncultured Caudovirales phage TaxID=2100421 RepID=A0A6J5SNS6_9CAUD|nr:hypothetical protein UFOVP1590_11 [uncultured Caudovirales phage]